MYTYINTHKTMYKCKNGIKQTKIRSMLVKLKWASGKDLQPFKIKQKFHFFSNFLSKLKNNIIKDLIRSS